jgi:hypothetical protein
MVVDTEHRGGGVDLSQPGGAASSMRCKTTVMPNVHASRAIAINTLI